MCYAPWHCLDHFTPGQRDRMFCAMENTSILQNAVILPGIPLVEYTDKSAATLIQYTGQPRNAASLDYNNDGYRDLIITRYDRITMAWSGNGINSAGVVQFSYDNITIFPSDNQPPAATSGIITADFDNDGYMDFFAPNQNSGGRLYRNVGGDHFEDFTAASGLDNPAWSYALANAFSCSWADYDADGILDLTLISSTGDPTYSGGTVTLLHNSGNYFDAEVPLSGSVGISPLWADFDGDGDLDLMVLHSVAVPLGGSPAYPDYFYINQGDGTFTEEAQARIMPLDIYYFGKVAAACDFDNDGDLDVVYAEEYDVTVLENDGSGYFNQVAMRVEGIVSDRCWPDASILTEGTYNVAITLSDLGGNKYQHTLTYANVDCEAKCDIPYSITSGVSDYVSASDEQHIKISSCVLSQ